MSRGASILITTYNRAAILADTLRSASALHLPEGVRAEILVIDNNCTDRTPETVAQAAAASPIPMRRVLETRQGLSYSRNRGLTEASFDWVVYFDDDVRIVPHWIEACFEAIDTLKPDCVVGPVTPAFESEPPAYISPRVLDSLCSTYSRKGDELMVLPPEVAHQVPGCNFAVRKQVALDAGGFDPRFGCGGETQRSGDDFEFGHRLNRAGRRVVYQPRCSVQHLITSGKFAKSWLRTRWRQDGAFERSMTAAPPNTTTRLERARAAAGIGSMLTRSAFFGLLGRRAASFEWELRARRAVGYYKGA